MEAQSSLCCCPFSWQSCESLLLECVAALCRRMLVELFPRKHRGPNGNHFLCLVHFVCDGIGLVCSNKISSSYWIARNHIVTASWNRTEYLFSQCHASIHHPIAP
ncbi:hypothetical protein COOONC_05937 [Cooperia oncophora]